MIFSMADPIPPVVQDVRDHAWQSAQRLAIEVMQRMGSLFTEVAREAGCTEQMAREFAAAMEHA
jgi:predicted transcriptional regulator